MAFVEVAANTLDDAYSISNSARFNDGDSPKLTRTPGSDGNRDIWTFSCWFKKTNVDETGDSHIFSCGSGGDDLTAISLRGSGDDEQIECYNYTDAGSTTRWAITAPASYRDSNAWYNLVLAVDTTQASISNGLKLWINGVAISYTGTTWVQNADTFMNSDDHENVIGARQNNNDMFFDGYLADVHFIDGTQKAASDFGKTNDNGIWIPIKYTGSYGTNGFFLEFKETGTSADASGKGADTSGNTNHFDDANMDTHDITTDTPTNNFMTMNHLSQYGITFAEGNLSVQGANSSGYSVCTGGWEVPPTGKWYYEVEVDVFGGTNHEYLGIKRSDLKLEAGAYDLHNSTCQWYQSTDGSNGAFRDETSTTATATALRHSAGDILMVAIDISNEKMWFGKNGTWYDDDATTDGDPANGSNPTCTPNNDYEWHFFSGGGNNAVKYLYNFGNPPFSISSGNADANGYGNFEYAVPSGFYALCTKNLGEYG